MSVKYFDKEKNKWIAFPGTIGASGESSYEVAVKNGYKGTYEDYVSIISKTPDLIDKVDNIINNIDSVPSENSDNLVKSGGIYSAIYDLNSAIDEKLSNIDDIVSDDFLKRDEISATASATLSDTTSASVEYNNGVFNFHFNIEKGEKGDQGDPGTGGVTDEQLQDIVKNQTEFEKSINNVLQELDNKANISDVPTDYVKSDVIDGVFDAINNIDTTVSADDVASVLDSEMVANVVNGKNIIEGTAIKDGAIATRHMVANSISGTVITSGTIIGDKIQGDTITSNHIKSGAVTAEKISGIPSGMTIMSHDTEDDSTWILKSDGSARFGKKGSTGVLISNDGTVTITADNIGGENIVDSLAQERLNEVDQLITDINNNISALNTDINDKSATAEANAKADADAKLAAYKTEVDNNLQSINNKYISIDGNIKDLNAVDELLLSLTDNVDGATVIDGGKIKTDSITADAIVAGAINTALIEGGGLSGLTIKSNPTSPVWEINEDGSAKFANGNVEFKADGNVNFAESVSISWNNISDKDDAKNDITGNKLTNINSDGIYIGDLSAEQVTTGTLKSNATFDFNGDESPVWKLQQDGTCWFGQRAMVVQNDTITLREGVKMKFDGSETGLRDYIQNLSDKSKSLEGDLISASEVVDKLNNGDNLAELINGITNNENKITGSAIKDGSIAAEKIVANSITSTQIQSGAITADKIDTKDLVVPKISSTNNDSASYVYLGDGGISISVGDVIFKVDSNGITIKDSSTEGEMKLFQYVIHQYKQENYTIDETSTDYQYDLDSTSHDIMFSLISGSTNSIELPQGEDVVFSLNATKRDCVTPVTYKNGIPTRGSQSCGSWHNTEDRVWTVTSYGGVTATINSEVLTIKKESSGSVSLRNGTGDALEFNII